MLLAARVPFSEEELMIPAVSAVIDAVKRSNEAIDGVFDALSALLEAYLRGDAVVAICM